jgi:hypothetical protein
MAKEKITPKSDDKGKFAAQSFVPTPSKPKQAVQPTPTPTPKKEGKKD